MVYHHPQNLPILPRDRKVAASFLLLRTHRQTDKLESKTNNKGSLGTAECEFHICYKITATYTTTWHGVSQGVAGMPGNR